YETDIYLLYWDMKLILVLLGFLTVLSCQKGNDNPAPPIQQGPNNINDSDTVQTPVINPIEIYTANKTELCIAWRSKKGVMKAEAARIKLHGSWNNPHLQVFFPKNLHDTTEELSRYCIPSYMFSVGCFY